MKTEDPKNAPFAPLAPGICKFVARLRTATPLVRPVQYFGPTQAAVEHSAAQYVNNAVALDAEDYFEVCRIDEVAVSRVTVEQVRKDKAS